MTAARENQRFILWVVLALVVAAALISFVVDRRSRVIETVLRDWASRQVAAATDSTYQLSVSGVDLSVMGGRIIIDSIRLVTDTLRNDFRAEPLPVLNATRHRMRRPGRERLGPPAGRGRECPALPLRVRSTLTCSRWCGAGIR